MTFRSTAPLKVMFLIDLLDKMGGAERSLNLLARGLKDCGHEVVIISLKGGELSRKMRRQGYYIEEINLTRIYGVKGLLALFKIVKIVGQEKVSVIISYHESSDFMGLLISALSRIPIISSRRDMGFKLKPRHVAAYRFLNRYFSHIVTVSAAVKEHVVDTQGAKPSHITVIPNGVDLCPGSSVSSEKVSNLENELEIDDGLLKVCCLANIRPIKGHTDLIAAACEVAKQFPAVRFYLIGKKDVDEAYYQDLQRQVEALGLKQFIKFTGELPSGRVLPVLERMDISVLPSLSEGMSNTVLESMAAAIPVVATAVGGNPEVVVDGKTGHLVPPGDPKSLARALLKLMVQPELRRKMGLRGRSRVRSLYSIKQMVNRYEDLIQCVYQKKNFNS